MVNFMNEMWTDYYTNCIVELVNEDSTSKPNLQYNNFEG